MSTLLAHGSWTTRLQPTAVEYSATHIKVRQHISWRPRSSGAAAGHSAERRTTWPPGRCGLTRASLEVAEVAGTSFQGGAAEAATQHSNKLAVISAKRPA